MQLIKKLIFNIALMLFFSGAAFAAPITVSTNKQSYDIAETIKLRIIVSDTEMKDIDFAEDTADYKVIGNSSSFSIQIINGVQTQKKELTYILRAKHQGAITIPAITAAGSGKSYSSKPFQLNITKMQAQAYQKKPKPMANRRPPSRRQQAMTRSNTRNPAADIFARFAVDNAKPYQNQQMLLKLKIFHKGNLRSINVPPLELNDFIQRKDDRAKEYKQTSNGEQYLVYELDYILFPIKSGRLNISSYNVEAVALQENRYSRNFGTLGFMNPFVSEQQLKLPTNSISINVRPLPTGAPAGFTGYVGDLVVNNEVNSTQVNAGDAVSLKSKIYGNGNLKSLKLDRVKESQQYSLFKDKESINEEINNAVLYYEAISQTAVIPSKANGKLSLDLLPLINFNPKTGKYEKHGQEHFEIDILPGSKQESSISSEKSSRTNKTQIKQDEILAITADQVKAYGTNPIKELYLLIFLVLLNFAAVIIFAFSKIQNIQVASPDERKDIKDLKEKIKKAENLVDISKSLRDLISRYEIDDVLIKQNIDEFFKESDFANYGSSSNDEAKLEYFREKALAISKELKKQNKKEAINA